MYMHLSLIHFIFSYPKFNAYASSNVLVQETMNKLYCGLVLLQVLVKAADPSMRVGEDENAMLKY